VPFTVVLSKHLVYLHKHKYGAWRVIVSHSKFAWPILTLIAWWSELLQNIVGCI